MIPDDIELPDPLSAAELVADRRGSRVWKVTLADGRIIALKYATDNQETAGVRVGARDLAAREAAVLRRLANDDLYAAGQTATGTWLAVAWHPGPTIARWWREVDTDPAARPAAASAAQRAAQAVAGLHEQGWRHGDLQPDHILVADHGPVRLIDLALAQGPVAVEPTIPYRGALAHLTAPETAAEILATPPDQAIDLTMAAEVYMLAATLHVCWTRKWPYGYEAADPRMLTVEQIHIAITDPANRGPLPATWPALSALLEAMLDPEPASRPGAGEVAAALAAIAVSS